MSIVSCNSTNEKNVSHSIANFISAYGIIRLLAKCGCTKIKGVSAKELFTYILTNVFHAGSFYMQQKADNIQIAFSKNTYYRFLTNPHVNWLCFVTSLSENIINKHILNLATIVLLSTTQFTSVLAIRKRNWHHLSSIMWL